MTKRKAKKQPPRLNSISLEDVPFDEQVLPTMHEGKLLYSRKKFQKLMNGTRNHKKNVDGLVYQASQAPNRSNTNGWKHVIWGPIDENYVRWSEDSLFKIQTKNDGYILVQFLKNDIDNTIREGVDYFLKKHSSVRDKSKHEEGLMVGAGLRRDSRTAALRRYSNTKCKSSNSEQQKQKDCFIAFNNLIRNGSTSSVFREDHKKTINELSEVHNILKIPARKGKHSFELLPSYAASESLNNSLHIDCNDASRCYAVFYQEQKHLGKSFLVFPKYGLAINCSRYNVLVSWEGHRQQHCTLRVEEGVRSLFGGANRQVETMQGLLRAFANPPKRAEKNLKEGDTIYVELHQETDRLAEYDDIYKIKRQNGSRYVVRKAKIKKIDGVDVTFTYLGNYKDKIGQVKVPDTLVLPIRKKVRK